MGKRSSKMPWTTVLTGGLIGKGGLLGEGSLTGGKGPGYKKTYYGGSKEAQVAERAESLENLRSGRVAAGAKLEDVKAQAAAGKASLANFAYEAKRKDLENTEYARAYDQKALAGLDSYNDGRTAILRDAQALERNAAMAGRDYKQTSDAQFAAQQDANQRAALSLGATGGATGVRSALAASSTANSQASTQAAIIQAQELNRIRAEKQSAIAAAAGIRGDVGARDISAAGTAAGRAYSASNVALGALGLAGQATSTGAQVGLDGAQSALGGATALSGQDLSRYTAVMGGQNNADREYAAAMAAYNASNKGLLKLVGL